MILVCRGLGLGNGKGNGAQNADVGVIASRPDGVHRIVLDNSLLHCFIAGTP
jgi:hypothetical protein